MDTDPVVSAHGVEAVGTTDEYQVVVSGDQHFDEVVALLLKTDTTWESALRGSQHHLQSMSVQWNIKQKRCEVNVFFYTYSAFSLDSTHVSVSLARSPR